MLNGNKTAVQTKLYFMGINTILVHTTMFYSVLLCHKPGILYDTVIAVMSLFPLYPTVCVSLFSPDNRKGSTLRTCPGWTGSSVSACLSPSLYKDGFPA